MFSKQLFKNTDGTVDGRIHVYWVADKPWFKAAEITKFLGYKRTDNPIHQHVSDTDKMNWTELQEKLSGNQDLQDFSAETSPIKGGKPAIFINKIGLTALIRNCRLPKSYEIAEALGIEMIHKITTKETDIMNQLIKVFDQAGIKYIHQYNVNIAHSVYRIDCYLPQYKIAIEIDEFDHKDRDPEYEKSRMSALEEHLKCVFIRVNPDDKKFSSFNFIGRIFKEILNKQSTVVIDDRISQEDAIKYPIKLLDQEITTNQSDDLSIINQSDTPKTLENPIHIGGIDTPVKASRV